MNLAPIAIWILKRELKKEDYRKTWEANIAVCMQDAYFSKKGRNSFIHAISNDGAKRFIDLLLK